MPQTMTEVDDFRKTINQASIEAIFQFAMHSLKAGKINEVIAAARASGEAFT
jgi:hypothetical protein